MNISDKLLPVLIADDTNLLMSGNNIDHMILTMNEELKKLVIWLNTNKLFLNVKKTHYVIVKPGRTLVLTKESLTFGNQIIKKEETTTFLEVKLDSILPGHSIFRVSRSKLQRI